MNREAFHEGIERLLSLQKKLQHPPKRKHIHEFVRTIVKEANLREDSRRRYFELLATCALMGKESMYWNFKSKRRK